MGCHKSRCSYTYHFTCGLNNGCLMQYYENFRYSTRFKYYINLHNIYIRLLIVFILYEINLNNILVLIF